MPKNTNDCTSCGFSKALCKCAGAGGGSDDSNAKKESEMSADNKRDTSANSVNTFIMNSQAVIKSDEPHITLFDENNQLIRCMLFASTANQLTPAPSNNFQEENDSNAANTSGVMRMKMGDADE